MSGIELKFDGAKDVSQPVNLTFYPEGWNAAGVNLVFSDVLDTSHPVKLKFGTGGTEEPEAVNAHLSFLAVVPAPRLSGLILHSRVVSLAATVPAPTLSATLAYDNAVYRGPNAAIHPAWQVADPAPAATAMGFQSTIRHPAACASPFQDAQKMHSITQLPWQNNLSTRTDALSRFQDGIKVGTDTTDCQSNMLRLCNSAVTLWQDGIKVVADRHTGWQDRFRYPRPELASRWAEAKKLGIDRTTTAGAGKPLQTETESYWQIAQKPPAGTYTWTAPVAPTEPGCYTPPHGGDVPLLFRDVFSSSADLLFYCASKRDPGRRAGANQKDLYRAQ